MRLGSPQGYRRLTNPSRQLRCVVVTSQVRSWVAPASVLFVLGATSMYIGAALAVGLFDQLSPPAVAVLRLFGAASLGTAVAVEFCGPVAVAAVRGVVGARGRGDVGGLCGTRQAGREGWLRAATGRPPLIAAIARHGLTGAELATLRSQIRAARAWSWYPWSQYPRDRAGGYCGRPRPRSVEICGSAT